MEAGALACSISGAGPAIFALCNERSLADEVALAMQQVYDKQKLASKKFVGSINHEGTVLM